jgi:ribosomal protein L11 methyltransferase
MALDRLLKSKRFERPLDLGTGTGVLAIALARVLHVPVLATDIDRVAVDISIRNAALNRVAADFRGIVADGMTSDLIAREGPYDLVVANILARPLTRLAFPIAAQLARRSTVVLSGLRTVERQLVLSAYFAQGLRLAFEVERDGWLALVLETGDR